MRNFVFNHPLMVRTFIALYFLIIRSFIFIYSLIIRIFIIMSYDNYVKLFLSNMYHGQMLGCFSQLFWHPPREK